MCAAEKKQIKKELNINRLMKLVSVSITVGWIIGTLLSMYFGLH